MTQAIPVIDLFAGAGGLGIGAQQAGADLRLSVDNDRFSCETMRSNPDLHLGKVVEADVSALTGDYLREAAGLRGSNPPLVVIGGAPCQPFSKAAYWVDKGDEAAYRRARARGEVVQRSAEPLEVRPDHRRTLVHEFWRLVLESDADGFVFENVPSILHPRNRLVFEALVADAEGAGFKTTKVVATATDYGVAQARQRVFLLGSRLDKPAEPAKTHAKVGGDGLSPWVTASEALKPITAAPDEPGVQVAGRWAEHLREVPPGMNYKHHTDWAGHPNPTFVTETRYWNFLLKLDPDRPSWTIPASPGPWTGPFHWDSRRLTVDELAALQAFPAGYQFTGPRREQVRQIGNAVPSLMAAKMVGSVLEALKAKEIK